MGCDSWAKKYRVCEAATHNGTAAPEHGCRRNWNKSSQAKEPGVAMSLAKSRQQESVELEALVADDDAATIKCLREEMDVGIGN